MYPECARPCKIRIYNIVLKLFSAGSVLDKKKPRKRLVLTEERLDVIGARFKAVPKKPLRLLSLHSWLPKGTAHVATNLLNFLA